MLVLTPFIIGHILIYYIIFNIVKEKYERYNSGLPLFTEEKQSYMEILIKHYCKKDEKCCDCKCK